MARLCCLKSAQWTLFALAICSYVSAVQAQSVPCPGLISVVFSVSWNCTAPCQQATCHALVSFFNSTYNATTPHLNSWRNKRGWETALAQNCSQIVATRLPDGTPSYCGWHGVTCCSSLAQSLGKCYAANAVMGLKLPVNGLNGSILDPDFEHSVTQLHKCGLASLELQGNALSGSLADYWGNMTGLVQLNLAKNLIEGTIPDALQNLKNLMLLGLDRNPMHGTLPSWISELRSLRRLGLSAFTGLNEDGTQGLRGTIPRNISDLPLYALSLDSNSLTGQFPSGLCQSNMRLMVLRGNQIRGTVAQLLNCTNIVFLDIRNNKFGGTLPDVPTWGWKDIILLDMSDNEIEGPLPNALFGLQSVGQVLLGNNRLSGNISSLIVQMSGIVKLELHNNNLTGPIDESVWYMPRMETLDLSGNQLTGTISRAIGYSFYLTKLHLDNNNLTGPVPSELGILPGLSSVDLRNNSFTTPCTDSNTCDDKRLLPCFLRLSNTTNPRPDGSNMKCPLIERKPLEEAEKDCKGPDSTQLGTEVSNLPTDLPEYQSWYFDPSYYHFRGCQCLKGYQAVWQQNNTVLVCEIIPTSLPSWVVPLAAVLFAAGVLLLAAVGLMVWLKLTVQLRRKWQREKDLKNNRMKGVPSGGPAAIVVTDVEKYSDLMQRKAAVTTQAMGIHNALVRKAITTHAGYVIEQEGDSWSVAFHRPVDAVAFCLQVQQALQRAPWPAELLNMMSAKSVPERSAVSASALSTSSPATAEVIVRTQPRQPVKMSAASTEDSAEQRAEQLPASHLHDNDATTSSSLTGSMSNMVQRLLGRALKTANQSSAKGSALDSSDGAQEPANGEGASVIQGANVQTSSYRKSCNSMISYDRSTTATLASKATDSTTLSRLKGKHVKVTDGDVLGLRVRMGIASGWVPDGTDIHISAVFALAKGVSDMAHGGQIIMESRTADAVRDWLSDLGCVDHKGYNDKLLSTSHVQGARMSTSRFARWLINFMGSALRLSLTERNPILLDMGQFWVPSLASTVQAVTAAVTAGEANTKPVEAGERDITKESQTVDGSQPGFRACVAVAAGAMNRGRGVAGINAVRSVYTYSIVAHPLYERSKQWRADLNLREGTEQLIKGYFTAPGTMVADLSSPAKFLATDRRPLPPVTLVFAAVESGKQLMRKKDQQAVMVHNILSRVMQALLLSFPDGYLCREQEAVLKYMVAFREPARAAEWCMLVQEVLQLLPWPSEMIEALKSISPDVPADESKHPVLKMGLAEIMPESITPDHLGRADYLGGAVSLAAHIVDAVAHSGRLVMSRKVADSIFSTWRTEAELGLYTVTRADGAPETVAPGNMCPSAAPAAANPGRSASKLVRVSAHHLGVYAFKDCGELAMVCLTSDVMATNTEAQLATSGAKGALTRAADGPVLDLQDCPVVLPDTLPEFTQAWSRLVSVGP